MEYSPEEKRKILDLIRAIDKVRAAGLHVTLGEQKGYIPDTSKIGVRDDPIVVPEAQESDWITISEMAEEVSLSPAVVSYRWDRMDEGHSPATAWIKMTGRRSQKAFLASHLPAIRSALK